MTDRLTRYVTLGQALAFVEALGNPPVIVFHYHAALGVGEVPGPHDVAEVLRIVNPPQDYNGSVKKIHGLSAYLRAVSDRLDEIKLDTTTTRPGAGATATSVVATAAVPNDSFELDIRRRVRETWSGDYRKDLAAFQIEELPIASDEWLTERARRQ